MDDKFDLNNNWHNNDTLIKGKHNEPEITQGHLWGRNPYILMMVDAEHKSKIIKN